MSDQHITKRIADPETCVSMVVSFIVTATKFFYENIHSAFPTSLQEISDSISDKTGIRISVEAMERDSDQIIMELKKQGILYQKAQVIGTGEYEHRFYLRK